MSIVDREWDILLLLDACRYDYFRDIHKKYMTGKLTMDTSVGTSTQMWHQNNFKDQDCSDIYYITPIVNFTRWLPHYNFHKVVMSWKTHWNPTFGTVMADDTTTVALEHLNKEKNKRFVIHYMQPHVPYVSYPPKLSRDRPKPDSLDIKNQSMGFKMRFILSNKLTKYRIPNPWLWHITNIVGKNSYLGDIYINNGGWDGIKKAYTENLEYVLSQVKRITDTITDRKIVITSDHGERLGEKGLVGHCHKRRDKVIVEIPWFEVGV